MAIEKIPVNHHGAAMADINNKISNIILFSI
jgi:hypothetical protein